MCVAINNASLTFGEKILLDNLSLQFHSNALTVILGKNGTGKSSLLKVMSGDLPNRDTVTFYGRLREAWQSKSLAESVGFLPQHSALTFSFTAREVVELGGITLKRNRQDLSEIVNENMILTDVEHLTERRYPTLSGGEKQRVHLARVLTQLHDSQREKIIMLDEPTSALDIKHQHKTLSLAKTLAEQGACVIAVLHDLNLASKYADRIVMLDKGKVLADGKPEQVLTKEIIAAVYDWEGRVINHPEQGYPIVFD